MLLLPLSLLLVLFSSLLLNWPAGKALCSSKTGTESVVRLLRRERERTRELQAGRERKRDLKALVVVGRIESGTDTEQ